MPLSSDVQSTSRQEITGVEPVTRGRFDGLIVLVTGAGSGIGLATTLRIAQEGGRVIASDLDAARLQDLTDAHPTLDLLTVAGDVTDPAHIAELVEACGDQLDGLVNNAGINDGFVPVDEVEDLLWDKLIAVNLTAPFRLTRALLPLLRRSPRASIVNLASEAALRGSVSGTAYTVAKHGIVGLTRSTAFLCEGVRCNAIAPGGVATNVDATPLSERGAERIFGTAGKIAPPMAQPEQLASAITFLLSRDASNINGVVLPCDGGWSVV